MRRQRSTSFRGSPAPGQPEERRKLIIDMKIAMRHRDGIFAQRLQYPLMKEYTLNPIWDPATV